MSIDLTPEEREGLAAGIRKLAMERERKDDFDEFAKWLEDNGPVGVFVDGANVGMFNQNFADARFNFRQVGCARRREHQQAGPMGATGRYVCLTPGARVLMGCFVFLSRLWNLDRHSVSMASLPLGRFCMNDP